MMLDTTNNKRSTAYCAAFVCVLVLVCLLCMPQKAFASRTVCDPACRATLGTNVNRTDATEYSESGNSVKNLKLSINKYKATLGFVRLSFESKTKKGILSSTTAEFTLVVADRTGKVLAKYIDHVWCYWDGKHYLDFKISNFLYGERNMIEEFWYDYYKGGGNFLVYIESVSVDEKVNPSHPEWGIIQHPADQTAIAGQKTTFAIKTFGNNLSYQWHIDRNDGKGWAAIDGANAAEYTASVPDISCDGFKYYCKVINPDEGEMDSAAAVLHVVTLPETADSSQPALWLLILLMNIFVIMILRKKAKN